MTAVGRRARVPDGPPDRSSDRDDRSDLPDVVIADRPPTAVEVQRLEDELVAILADVIEREATIAV